MNIALGVGYGYAFTVKAEFNLTQFTPNDYRTGRACAEPLSIAFMKMIFSPSR